MIEIILNKKLTIERSIKQVRSFYKNCDKESFDTDYKTQDAISMNIQRSCEAAIDLANHVIKSNKLGLPANSRESFEILHSEEIIDDELLRSMKAAVGFRNILVHNYEKIEISILQNIIENHLDDLLEFSAIIIGHFGDNQIKE